MLSDMSPSLDIRKHLLVDTSKEILRLVSQTKMCAI